MTPLPPLLEAFFTDRLLKQRQASPHTVASYRDAFRLLIPEYYGKSCLGCHGEPKGERDITGGKKEGGRLGELGGAISVSIYGSAPASAQ